MSTRLDDFISNHRDDFDSEVPGSEVWNKIAQRVVPAKKSAKVFSFSAWKISAAAAVLVIMGMLAARYFIPETNTHSMAQVEKSVDTVGLNEINPAYAQQVYQFTKLVELKQEELKSFEKEQPELYKQFVSDIHQLDSNYHVLKLELPANPNREQLLEAMLQNLKMQMDLINRQLLIIDQIKTSKKTNHESNSKNL